VLYVLGGVVVARAASALGSRPDRREAMTISDGAESINERQHTPSEKSSGSRRR
jgi:hypothetical protein